MPNYVHLAVSVVGNDKLKEFTEQAKGTRKPTGDLPFFPNGRENPNYDNKREATVFEFDRLVPLPEAYSQLPYSDYGYEMESTTWGTKWGAFRHEKPKFEEGCATYRFTCAWDAPRLFFEKVSKSWPDFWFIVSYGGEGPTRGRFTLHDGSYIENIQGEKNWPNWRDYEDDDDKWDQVLGAWTHCYRNSHDAYIKQFITALYSNEEPEVH